MIVSTNVDGYSIATVLGNRFGLSVRAVNFLNNKINNKINKMTNDFTVSFLYAGRNLIFFKSIELPFTPFFGMGILTKMDGDVTVSLENSDTCLTEIIWNTTEQKFEVFVRNMWKYPVSDETLDETLDLFSEWGRVDRTNINDFKELMLNDSKLISDR